MNVDCAVVLEAQEDLATVAADGSTSMNSADDAWADRASAKNISFERKPLSSGSCSPFIA